MTEIKPRPQSRDLDEAIRLRILERVRPLHQEVLTRLTIAADDLDAGEHRAALGALDGIELQLDTMRSLLRLLV